MTAHVIQGEYEQLERVAGLFGRQAEQSGRLQQRVTQCVENLHRTGWIGQGSNAFYAELNDEVLPALGRLTAALEQAEETTLRISQLLSEAEEQASARFNGQYTAGVEAGEASIGGVIGSTIGDGSAGWVAPAPGQPGGWVAPPPGQPGGWVAPAPGQPGGWVAPAPGQPGGWVAPAPGQPGGWVAPPPGQPGGWVAPAPGQPGGSIGDNDHEQLLKTKS